MFFDSLDTTDIISKQEVFDIMGEYYGNAFYRTAIRQGFSKKELTIHKGLLDEINDLGYYFSNLHKLSYVADLRFMPILLKYYDMTEKKEGILQAMSHKEYSEYTPSVIELYKKATIETLRFNISSTLFVIRSRKYIDLYMEIAGSPDYIGDNLISVILCKYHIKEFSDRMLELYSKNPVAVSWNMANYGYMLNDRRMIPILDEIAKSNGGEISCAAKKTLRKLLVWCDKNSV